MLPFLFELGPIKLPTYGLLLCIAILVGLRMAVKRARRDKISVELVTNAALLAVLAALLGSKLTDWLRFGDAYSWRAFLTSGGTFLGGFLLASVVTILYLRAKRIPLWAVTDCLAAPLALGVAIVRLGCFAAGDDYGQPTDLPWGVVFTNPTAAEFTGVPLGVKLHPSQLYESGLGLVILAVLLTLERKQRRAGALILAFVGLYSVGRFSLEFLRGDMDRGFWGPLSTSQWFSIVAVLVFFGLFLREKLRGEATAASPRKP